MVRGSKTYPRGGSRLRTRPKHLLRLRLGYRLQLPTEALSEARSPWLTTRDRVPNLQFTTTRNATKSNA